MSKWILTVTLAVVASTVYAQDNDALAFKFINTEPEAIQIAYECLEDKKITTAQFRHIMSKSLVNVILDPRDFCEDLLEQTQ